MGAMGRVAEDKSRGGRAFLWAVGGVQAGLPSFPSPSQPPQTPQGTRQLSLAAAQATGQTGLTSYLLLGNQGPQEKVTGPGGGLSRAGGGDTAQIVCRGSDREGRRHLSVLRPLIGQDHLTILGPKDQE